MFIVQFLIEYCGDILFCRDSWLWLPTEYRHRNFEDFHYPAGSENTGKNKWAAILQKWFILRGIAKKFPDCAYWTKTTEGMSLKFMFYEIIIHGLQIAKDFWNRFGWLWCDGIECDHIQWPRNFEIALAGYNGVEFDHI